MQGFDASRDRYTGSLREQHLPIIGATKIIKQVSRLAYSDQRNQILHMTNFRSPKRPPDAEAETLVLETVEDSIQSPEDMSILEQPVPNSPFLLEDVVYALQHQTPFAEPLTIPLNQMKPILYYGLMGGKNMITHDVSETMRRLNLRYNFKKTGLILNELANAGLVPFEDRISRNGRSYSVWKFSNEKPLADVKIFSVDAPSVPHKDFSTSFPARPSGIRMSQEELRFLSILESLIGTHVFDCVWDREQKRIIFVVRQKDTRKVIGRGGTTIRRLRDHFQKQIDVIEYSDEIKEYAVNTLAPAKIDNVEILEKAGQKTVVVTVSPKERGKAIGKNSRNLQRSRLLMRRHFGVNNVIIQSFS